VVGGTGTAGAAVVDELTGRGHDARVLSRRAPDRPGVASVKRSGKWVG
jgi:uncharacterized protein YbjT (DUF2867 family)